MNKPFYRPELDVIRFFAFCCVFLHHSMPRGGSKVTPWLIPIANGLGFGLCLFFMLSAYLITTLLLKELDRTQTIQLGKFYKRRMLRIWPLYFAFIGFRTLWMLHAHKFHANRLWVIASLLLFANAVPAEAGVFHHLWSISVEEQFYLFWPGVTRWLGRRHLIFASIAMIVIANIVLTYYGLIHADLNIRVWFNSFVQFQMFGLGVMLALYAPPPEEIENSLFKRLIIFLGGLCAWAVASYGFAVKATGTVATGPISLMAGYALIGLGCVLFIYAFLGSTFWPKPLAYMGKISYGLYMFHTLVLEKLIPNGFSSWPVREVLRFALITALAAISYRFFESPFLRLKERFEVVQSRPVN